MLLTKNTAYLFPFPYFLIDENGFIKMKSNIAETLFPGALNFIDIVDRQSQEDLLKFLKVNFNGNVLKLPFLLDGYLTIFQIYKLHVDRRDEIHIFCFKDDNYFSLANEKMTVNECAHPINNTNINYYSDKNLPLQLQDQPVSIAHEIRNPLTTIKGFIQLLRPQLQDISSQHYADIALDELERVNNILHKHLGANKKLNNIVNLKNFLEKIYLLYTNETSLHKIKLNVESNSDSCLVIIKEDHLKQVLANLVRNAIESINDCNDDRMGEVNISSTIHDKMAAVTVEDNGIGISKENMQKLFDPFYTSKHGGTGIGLPICKEIIETYNGMISVCSEVNRGTKFKILLPVLQNN